MLGSIARNGDRPSLKKSPGSPGLFLDANRGSAHRANGVAHLSMNRSCCRPQWPEAPSSAGRAFFCVHFGT
jgi:hypothetical protein